MSIKRALSKATQRQLKSLAPFNVPGNVTKEDDSFILDEALSSSTNVRRKRKSSIVPDCAPKSNHNFTETNNKSKKRKSIIRSRKSLSKSSRDVVNTAFVCGDEERKKKKSSNVRENVSSKTKRKVVNAEIAPVSVTDNGERKKTKLSSSKTARNAATDIVTIGASAGVDNITSNLVALRKATGNSSLPTNVVDPESLSKESEAMSIVPQPQPIDSVLVNDKLDASVKKTLPKSVQRALQRLAPFNDPGGATDGDNAFILNNALSSSSSSRIRRNRRSRNSI